METIYMCVEMIGIFSIRIKSINNIVYGFG